MGEMRFDGQVAIVTGAGAPEGLGRAHALLLASRGAKVVVNDLGTGPDGLNLQRRHAGRVADEIREHGGEAIADTNSVAEEGSARAIVQTAIDHYGRIDILVNNAGIVRLRDFASLTSDDITQSVAVHQMGTIWMCKAVWQHMLGQSYGRIVNTTSVAMWGAPYTVIYGSVKAAILGLTRGLAVEGAPRDVKVNMLAPHAETTTSEYFRNLEGNPRRALHPVKADRPPEAVAPAVAYLAHSDCFL